MNGVEYSHDAIRLKELGNQDFKNGHYDRAIENYSRAIGTSSSKTPANLARIPDT